MSKKVVPYLLLLLCLQLSVWSTASAAGPLTLDTLPATGKTPEQTMAKNEEALIKEVPKVRKQEKPIAVVPVVIKPVFVKPKIIVKPIIKIQ